MRINWIYTELDLSGGVRCNHLFAEAMVRRGHEVASVYSTAPRRRPAWWRLDKRLPARRRPQAGSAPPSNPSSNPSSRPSPRGYLENSLTRLVPVNRRPIPALAVPDAEVTIATWWQTREWLETWPDAKGVKAYFIHHHELFGGDPNRVAATYRMPGLKFVVSSWLKRLMAEQYGDPEAVLVPNGVDRSQFDSEPRAQPRRPTVGFLYSPVPWKGADTVLQAIQRLRRGRPDLRVVAFGSKPPSAQYARMFEGIEFIHKPPQDHIPDIYKRTTCWIVPSVSEGFGMPGLEAAACHTPIVSTRCGGPEDFVEDQVNGYLVEVGDDQAMAHAVERVLSLDDDDWQAMSRASYAISQRFDWDRSAAILETSLERAVRG